MRTIRSMAGSGAVTKLRAVAAVGAVGAVLGAFGIKTAAAAQPVSITLTYACVGYPISVKIEADIPNSTRVGAATPRFRIDSVTTVGAAATRGASLVGVKTVEGTGLAKAKVTAPEGETPLAVPIDIPRTTVPTSGSAQISASGVAPSLKFSQPGRGKITISDITLHVVPKDARGNQTVLGELDLTCKQNAGQDNVLMSFEITRATSGPTTSGPRGSTPPGGTAPRTDGTTGSNANNIVGDAAAGATTGPASTGGTSDSASATIGGTAAGADGPVSTDSVSSADGADTTSATSLDLGDLILLALGVLVLGAAALRFGLRLKYRGRRADADS